MRITKNLEDLQRRISAACLAAGRNENEVSILAVSKRHSVAAIKEAEAAGLTAMGENYVQEALLKMPQLSSHLDWHFIGRIQSNKTRLIAENFNWAHTVCSAKIAGRLSAQRPEAKGPLNVCIQINVDNGEHGGIEPDAAAHLCATIAELPQLRLRGLMTIPVPATDIEAQRRPFRIVRELYDKLRADGLVLDTLSMGMTNDLEAAILEGSTMLRIGTALFGQRSAG